MFFFSWSSVLFLKSVLHISENFDCVLDIWNFNLWRFVIFCYFFSNDYFSFLLFSVGDFLKVCTESSALSAAAVVSVYIFCHLSSLYTFFIQGSILALLPYCIPPLSIHGFPAFLSWCFRPERSWTFLHSFTVCHRNCT